MLRVRCLIHHTSLALFYSKVKDSTLSTTKQTLLNLYHDTTQHTLSHSLSLESKITQQNIEFVKLYLSRAVGVDLIYQLFNVNGQPKVMLECKERKV